MPSLATNNTAVIDGDGTTFSFIDSGAPADDVYTTLILIHGHTFVNQTFSRLLPLAKSRRLRVIAPNRRDYSGSTLFTEKELDQLRSKDKHDNLSFFRDRGLELAKFIAWSVKNLGLPTKVPEAGGHGGISVMGWSLGNATTMAFLTFFPTYPKEIRDVIRPLLRTFFVYEAGYSTIGYPHPDGAYHPLMDKTVPEKLRGVYFGTWVSSFYPHPYHAPRHPEVSPDLERIMKNLILKTPKEGDAGYRKSTFETLTPDELLKGVDPKPGPRSEALVYAVPLETIHEVALGTFLLDHTSLAAEGYGESDASDMPNVKVCVIYCQESLWSEQWSQWELEKEAEKWKDEGRKRRDMKIVTVPGANHFLHWVDSDKFLDIIQKEIGI